MDRDDKLFNVFHYTIEALEEYMEKIGYPGFKKQIFDKSINSPDRSPKDLASDFLSQLHILKAMIMITYKKPEYSHSEVQKEFYQCIDAAGIKAENCPEELNHYLFIINEILERRGENFVRQIEEEYDSVEADPRTAREDFSKHQEALNNPPERKEVNIKGNAENGKEIFQQIANAITLSDRQNFRFYPQQDKEKENNEGAGLSLSFKLAIGGISVAVLGILIFTNSKD